MLKDLGELAMNLVPPHDADPEKIYKWRVYLAATVVFMAGSLATHIALACGFLPAFFSGFASAAEVQTLAGVQQQMRKDSLSDALYTMRKDQCMAQASGNLQAAETQDQRIREKQQTYQQINGGQRYELPPCELFIARR